MMVGHHWAKWLKGDITYSVHSSEEKHKWGYLGNRPVRKKGWHKWEFVYVDEKKRLILKYDGKTSPGQWPKYFKQWTGAKWKGGISGIKIIGGDVRVNPEDNPLFIDDIKIEFK